MNIDPEPAATKSKLPLILGILGGGTLLVVLCCGGGTYWTVQKGMEPYVAATDAMNDNAELKEKLGTPIAHELQGINLKQLTNNNGEGGAEIGFRAKGPNGTATVNAKLGLTGGVWSVEELTAECSDGTTVTIPADLVVEETGDAPAEQELVPQQ